MPAPLARRADFKGRTNDSKLAPPRLQSLAASCFPLDPSAPLTWTRSYPIRHNSPMSRDDFDIASLARYLHLTPAQVIRLAEREELPGRRIAGQWRFSSQEVHHWLEQRLGTGT
jgi:excisionase family DNA binding protein